MKFNANKWNKPNENYTMLILTEEDIENESDEYLGVGYEILILPSKYKDTSSEYLDIIRMLVEVRSGEIIYV